MSIDGFATAGGAALIGFTAARFALAARSYVAERKAARRQQHAKLESLKQQVGGGANPGTLAPINGEAGWSGTRPFRIVRRIVESADQSICSFYLQPLDGQPLPSYSPGQFLSFSLPAGPSGERVHRCYSLSAGPAYPQSFYRVSVKRSQTPGFPVGVGSSIFHDRLAEGTVVDVLAPAGSFSVDQRSDRPVVLIAGGVGITPLLSMLHWIISTQSQREVWIFYGVRNRQDHAFRAQIAEICNQRPNVNCVMFYSQPTQACRRGVDYVCEGHVDVTVMRALLSARNYEFYMCGPPPMMTKVKSGLVEWGVPEHEIKTEEFGGGKSAPIVVPAPLQLTGPSSAAGVFQVHFERSGKSVPWASKNGSLLEFAELCGVPAQCACRVGQCGTCKLRLKSGEVSYLTDPSIAIEEGAFLPCISKPVSDIVVDL